MESLKQPKPMIMEGDIGANWKKFKNSFQVFLTATGGTAKAPEVQVAILLHCIGEQAFEIYETMELTATERKNYEVLLKKFDEYFLPKSNVSVETHKFNTRVQGQGESFDNFLSELRRLAANCDFGDFRDRLITDRIVSAIRDQRVKDRLLREPRLDLAKAIDICKAAEQTESHIRQLAEGTRSMELNEVKERKTYNNVSRRPKYKESSRNSQDKWKRDNQVSTAQQRSREAVRQNRPTEISKQKCSRCGRSHQYRQCPAFGKQCHQCSRYNHFAMCCKKQSVHVVNEDVNKIENETDFNEYCLGSLEINNITGDWFETVNILDCNK